MDGLSFEVEVPHKPSDTLLMNEITQAERLELELQAAHRLAVAWKEYSSELENPQDLDIHSFYTFIERFFGSRVIDNKDLVYKAEKLAGYWVEEEVAVSH